MIGFELCGTYLLDESWDGLTNTDKPLTSVGRISDVIEYMKGSPGATLAREALELVHDGSNSPMESVLCALLAWPRRLGGYAMGPVSLNHHVATADGDRYVDVAFPGHRVGLEYKGRRFHSIEQAGRDDRRQNKLVGSGWTILNVWYEDIVEERLYDQLVDDIAYAMGPVSLNHHVATADGDRYVDVAFPGHRVGLEYKGRRFHSIEQAGRDDRRQNKLVGSGWTILNVWYEDIVEERLYDQLVDDIARAMGVRLRIRSDGFDARRNVLRMRLIPAFRRYASALAG